MKTIKTFQFTKVAAEKEESKGAGGSIAAGGLVSGSTRAAKNYYNKNKKD
jgi:hypothetical protein